MRRGRGQEKNGKEMVRRGKGDTERNKSDKYIKEVEDKIQVVIREKRWWTR